MIPRNKIYSRLAQIALRDFADIVENASIIEGKLRLFIKDGSFIDKLIQGFPCHPRMLLSGIWFFKQLNNQIPAQNHCGNDN